MSDFPSQKWEQDLVDGLIQAGNENASLKGDGAREKAMANLAEPIAEAIKNGGGSIHWVGSFTVNELNNLENPDFGGIYGVKDSGELVNKDGSKLQVSPNDTVIWNGEKWSGFIDIDLEEYAKKTDVASAIAAESAVRVSSENAITSELHSHTGDLNNPHNVTPEQIGAATKDELETLYETKSDAKAKAENYGLLMRERGKNTLQFYRPALG